MGGWGHLASGNLGVAQKYHVLNAHRDTESEGQNRTSGLLIHSLTILGLLARPGRDSCRLLSALDGIQYDAGRTQRRLLRNQLRSIIRE